MDPASPSPYPGFDNSGQYYTPRKAPRVRPEAAEIATKNAGTVNLFNAEKHTHVAAGPPPSPRCPSYEAKENYTKGRKGLVGGLLGGDGPRPAADTAPQPRVKPEAEDIAKHHKGGNMSQLITRDSRRPQSARAAPRVKVEASENAELDRGLRIDGLVHNPKSMPPSPKPMPRVKPEAEQTAEKGAGSQMAKVMFKYGTTPRSTRAVPRVKSEASDNYTLDQGKRMQGLLDRYGRQSQSARPMPRVRDGGHDNANLDQGGRLSRLMHEGDKLPRDSRPPPRAASASGRRILKKNQQGSISQIFGETSKWQMVPTPGIRSSAKAF
ncbi:hypothetical protein ACOMHN_018257 [Nucella lapillus]